MTGETFPALLWALLLQDFPESLVTTLFVFSLLNLRLRDKRVLFIALLQTFTNLVRLLPIAVGVHSVILVVSLVVYTQLFTGIRLSRIFAAVLLCFILIIGAELAYVGPLLNLTGLPYQTVFANPFLRAAFALPYEAVLLGLALAKNHYNHKKGLLTGLPAKGGD